MKRILQGLSDIIFPPKCLGCDTIFDPLDALPVCPACLAKIKFISSPLCSRCGIPFSGADASDHLCGDCILFEPAFTAARSVAHYESIILDAIHHFKYNGKTSLGTMLGSWMAKYEYSGFDISEFSLLMPVPLHPKRLRKRGFNQSVILAKEIAERFHFPLDFLTLKRYIDTDSQIHLGKKERASNVRGAFIISDPGRIKDQKIILVDDVYTTGSTVKECSRLLMEKGASSVAVLTLARAVY